MSRGQSGNAILIILIAVFLFGALAAAFMRGARSGKTNLTASQTKLAAQQILEYSALLGRTVNKLRQRNCAENYISFEAGSNGFANASAPVDMSCHVYNAAGGNITVADFTNYMVPSGSRVWGANRFFSGTAMQGVGTAAPELVFNVPDLRLEVCEAINKELSISGPISQDTVATTFATGNLASTPSETYGDNGTNVAGIVGKEEFCGQTTAGYTYFKVLISR